MYINEFEKLSRNIEITKSKILIKQIKTNLRMNKEVITKIEK